MVSLDPELSKLFLLLMSTRHSSGPQNGSTSANFLKRKLETSFLQHESKIEDSLQFFPDYPMPMGLVFDEILDYENWITWFTEDIEPDYSKGMHDKDDFRHSRNAGKIFSPPWIVVYNKLH